MSGSEPPELEEARLSAPPSEITIEKLTAFVSMNPGVDSSASPCIKYATWLFSGRAETIKGIKSCSPEMMQNANNDRRCLFFVEFCKTSTKYADLFETTADGQRPVFTLKTDTYKLWDAVHEWWHHRCSQVSGKLDNGWFRHAARLVARYQEFTLLGVQRWWRDDNSDRGSNNDDPLDPPAKKKKTIDVPKEVPVVAEEESFISNNEMGGQKAEVEEDAKEEDNNPPTRDVSSCMSRRKNEECVESPCIPQQTIDAPPSPSLVRARAPPPRAPPSKIKLSPKEWVPKFGWGSHQQQLACYLGFNVQLVEFCRELERRRIEKNRPGGVSTKDIRKWLSAHPEFIPDHLKDIAWEVDHIISDGLGGIPWVFNYYMMPKSDNDHFNEFMNKEKKRYVGATVFAAAKSFARWYRARSLMFVQCGRYDMKLDWIQGRM